MIRKFLLFFLFVALGLLPLVLHAAEDSINADNTQSRLDDIEREKASIRQKLQDTVAKEKNVLQQVSKLRYELKKNKNQLDVVQSNLGRKKTRITQLQGSLQASTEKFKTHQDKFSKRIREIYQSQNLGYLMFLFSARGWDQILQHQYTFERIIEHDVDLMHNMESEMDRLRRQKDLLHHEEIQLHGLSKDLQAVVGEIQYKEQLQSAYKDQLSKQREDYEKRIAELEQTSHEIENMLRNVGSGEQLGTGRMTLPAKGWISSPFGWRRHPIFKVTKFHSGVDIAAPRGRKIVAADSGKVVHASWWGGYGQATIIDHGEGLTTVYAHQSRIVVAVGQGVNKGDTIGYIGSTGNATGPHLHFEVRKQGTPVDPMLYLRGAEFDDGGSTDSDS